jgi:hypothetical protein
VCTAAHAQTKFYYVTPTGHKGNDVLEACAEGYHFASISELQNFSELAYDTEADLSDSSKFDHGHGFGLGYRAWVRSGYINDSAMNCNGWTTADSLNRGTWVQLNYDIESMQEWPGVSEFEFQWTGGRISCDTAFRVYCVADPVVPIAPEILYCDGFESPSTQ